MLKNFLFACFLLALPGSLLAQCLSTPSCPAFPVTYCDVTPNDTQLWNDPLFMDPLIGGHDLAEVPANLSVQITNICGTGDVQVAFVLWLDLDHDDSLETAISSLALPGTDTVYFGNGANPDFSGGQARAFDQRPVAADQKYIFALEKTVQGNVVTARVRWTTAAAPGTYVDPQLPYGTYRIDWFFAKDGETQTCHYSFIAKDCKAPTVHCLNGLSVNILPTQMIQLFGQDFLSYAEDNSTPQAQLQFGLRRSGTGTGFPVDAQGLPVNNVVFTCQDQGMQPVELWAIDLAGNADYCETYVLVQDNENNCEDLPMITTCAKTFCDETGIPEVSFYLTSISNPSSPVNYSDASGCVQISTNLLIPGILIWPNKDNHPLDGVNTLDLVLMARHILGIEALGDPFKIIAAGVSKSGDLSSFDIAELRKLILGTYQELPNNTSWRFVDREFTFPNPEDPFETAFPEYKLYDTIFPPLNYNFEGVKIGDVNCTALQAPVQPAEQATLTMPNLLLAANELAEIPVSFAQAQDYYGFQFGLHFNPALVQIMGVLPVVGGQDNFAVSPNQLNVSWSRPLPLSFLPDEPVCRLLVKALAPGHVATFFSLAQNDLRPEAYPNLVNDSLVGLQLAFGTVAVQEPKDPLQIFAPQPNPTAAGLRFPLHLEQSAALTLEILDACGRLTYRQTQAIGAGAQFLEVPATAFPQAGLYGWRVQAGAKFSSGKVVRE